MKRLMKLSTSKSILALVLGAALTAQAGIYSYSGSSYNIPDGSLAGVSSQINVSGEVGSLTHIEVTLNLSGGYNGDLYAYLSYNGALVPILDRIGVSSGNPFGASGAGMSTLVLSDLGVNNIHTAGGGVLSGTWRPDGQTTSPIAPAASFSPTGGSITLDGTFGGMNPNGAWTLFFADVSAGGGTSQLTGWSLNITSALVPEPVNVALAVFGGLLVVLKLVSWRRQQRA